MPHLASVRLGPLVAVLLLTGCAASGPVAPVPPRDARPDDGLLARPDLQAVVDLGVRRDGPALADRLTEADPAVRARAALVLGSVQDPETVPALIDALGDDVPSVRADVAWALGQTADSSAAPFLFRTLRAEGTPSVRRQILEAIGKVGSQADGDELLRLPLAQESEADRLLALARLAMRDRLSPQAFAVVAQRLRGPDLRAREMAAYVFARSDGWGAQAALVRDAFDAAGPREPARFHLARAIGSLQDPADAARLGAALDRDRDWRVRVAAANALGTITEADRARRALLDALDDEIHHVRIAAAAALARAEALPEAEVDRAEAWVASRDSSDWHAAAALLPVLATAGRSASVLAWVDRHADPFARAAGISALAALDDTASVGRLLSLTEAEDTRVRTAALSALATRWRRGRETLDAARLYPAFRDALRTRDQAAVTLAAPILADSLFLPLGSADLLRTTYRGLRAPADLEAMTAILGAIGDLRETGEIDFLVDIALGDNDARLKRAAIDALNDRLVEGIDVDLTLSASAAVPPTPAIDWGFLARLGSSPRMMLTTTRGEIVIAMDPERAPQTVQSLTKTTREGLYDGVPFHRVVPAFVAQGGDHFRRDGWGGPETPIRSEFSRRSYRTGIAGMASSGRDTEGVQFFVMHAPHPHLDGRYTVWGEIVEGQAVADDLRVGDVILIARVLPDMETRDADAE